MRDRTEQAEHYRKKAEEVRVIAESTRGAEPRRFLMTVVADYLMLAEALEHTQLGDMLPASE